ncbi:hypothetical protein [Flindersiella endophytica]
MSRDLQAFYAEGRRQHEVAKAEFDAFVRLGPFTVAPDALAWAGELVGTAVASLPLTRATLAAWRPVLGTDSKLTGLYRMLAETAQRDGILRTPAPGLVSSAFAYRDRDTEVETALGYGFWPDGAECLVVHGSHAVEWDKLAGGPDILGAAALVAAVGIMAETLNAGRPATRQQNPPRQPGARFHPTSWTPASQ